MVNLNFDSQNSKQINLLMCVDQNMIIPMIVSLTSSINTLKSNEKINAYIFTRGINKELKQCVEKLCSKGPIDFFWKEISDARIEYFVMNHGYPAAPFFRFLIGDLLPDHVDRIVYLDADTLVCKPISYLYETKLDDFVVGAVTDINRPWLGMQRGCIPACKAGIPTNAPYFNSGVMVINVSRFRAENLGQKALQYATQYADKLDYWDQDALNVVLHSCWKPLDPRWNQVSSIHFDYGIAHCQLSIEKLTQLRTDPWIIHYTGALPRPWIDPNGHPLASLWIEVFKTTNLFGYKLYKCSENKAAKLLEKLLRAFSNFIRLRK